MRDIFRYTVSHRRCDARMIRGWRCGYHSRARVRWLDYAAVARRVEACHIHAGMIRRQVFPYATAIDILPYVRFRLRKAREVQL